MKEEDRYSRLIEAVFFDHYKNKTESFEFEREEIERHADQLAIPLPKNLGDLIYSFRYRKTLPEKILNTCPSGKTWMILPAGRSKYRFQLSDIIDIRPNPNLVQTKIPDATPGIISSYALSDEQALLAKVRYNRLIDIFTHITSYSLQNHLRTTVSGMGQVETDELYVGLDRHGIHYIIPVQAKGGKDQLSIVQIQQDLQLCSEKFPNLICKPIAAQFLDEDIIALFEFVETNEGVRIANEKHYKLAPPDDITENDLLTYRKLQSE